MSLTRDEWIEVWGACQAILRELSRGPHKAPRKMVVREQVQIIKDFVQQVIGQME